VVFSQLARDQVRLDLVAHAHVQVEAFRRHVDQPVEDVQPHLQPRIPGHQLRHGGRHHVAAKAETAAHPQQAARLALGGAHFLHQMVDVVEDALRPLEDAFALLRDGHAPRGAVQQLHAQFLFEQANALAHVGRRGAQFLRRRREARAAHHGEEDAQILGQQVFRHDL